jgi:glycosyltransferase involved in cell wall biosynthesis
MINLLACTKYGDLAASSRQRYLQYTGHLRSNGVNLEVLPLLDNNYLQATFSGRAVSKLNLAMSYIRRFQGILREREVDGIWLQYEFFPYAPGFLETLALSHGIPLVLDYDDAIFHQYDQHKNPIVRAMLAGKLKPLLRRAELAICGNAYLQEYAAQYCRCSEIVPTVVDTDVYGPVMEHKTDPRVIIGWIGSPSTWSFVRPLVPLLSELSERLDLKVRVVGAGPQKETPPRFEFLPWTEAKEIRLIQGMDIGIMPLPDEPWARGKCGYKLIQYMACGLPVIAAPVGVNRDIVDHGSNGFLASGPEEWAKAVTVLAENAELRLTMGAAGRKKVERAYSLAAQGPRLAEMLRRVLEQGRSHCTNKLARA